MDARPECLVFFIPSNMEIYRTDGGGRLENPPRLIAVIGMVMQRIPDTEYIWNNIDSIEDKRGHLWISFNVKYSDDAAVFKFRTELEKAWDYFGEDSRRITIMVHNERASKKQRLEASNG